jgi:hypothetical protein
MFKKFFVASAAILLLGVFSQSPALGQSRLKLPNDFGIELLGKSLLYTFSYQRVVGQTLGLEAGISALGGGGSGSSSTIVFIPLGAKLYFVPKNGSPFIAGGITVVTASVDSGPFSDSESTSYGHAGLGFEFRSPGGFLFRGTAYGLFSGGSFFIWPGLHVGYAF